jgi:hypothetical protein
MSLDSSTVVASASISDEPTVTPTLGMYLDALCKHVEAHFAVSGPEVYQRGFENDDGQDEGSTDEEFRLMNDSQCSRFPSIVNAQGVRLHNLVVNRAFHPEGITYKAEIYVGNGEVEPSTFNFSCIDTPEQAVKMVASFFLALKPCTECSNVHHGKAGSCPRCIMRAMTGARRDTCTICMVDSVCLVTTSCGHRFHKYCLEKVNRKPNAEGQWKQNCPNCRHELRAPPDW